MAGIKGKSGAKKGREITWNLGNNGRKKSSEPRTKNINIRCTANERLAITKKINELKKEYNFKTLAETLIYILKTK